MRYFFFSSMFKKLGTETNDVQNFGIGPLKKFPTKRLLHDIVIDNHPTAKGQPIAILGITEMTEEEYLNFWL